MSVCERARGREGGVCARVCFCTFVCVWRGGGGGGCLWLTTLPDCSCLYI